MVGAPAAADRGTKDFLSGFDLVDVDADVAARAVLLRREHRLKLPDAIVWASARVRGHAGRHAGCEAVPRRRSRSTDSVPEAVRSSVPRGVLFQKVPRRLSRLRLEPFFQRRERRHAVQPEDPEAIS